MGQSSARRASRGNGSHGVRTGGRRQRPSRKRLPRRSVQPHRQEECGADHGITGDRENAVFPEPELVVAARKQRREEPLGDRVVEAVEEDGRPETPRPVRLMGPDERERQIAGNE